MAREERRRTAKNVAVPTNSNITELLREHIRIILLYREPLGSNLKVKKSLLWPWGLALLAYIKMKKIIFSTGYIYNSEIRTE